MTVLNFSTCFMIRRTMLLWYVLGAAAVFLSGCALPELPGPPQPESGPTTSPGKVRKVEDPQYTFGYWLHGFRKTPGDTSADILCFEAGQYGFTLDVDDLANPKFGPLDDGLDYEQALAAGTRRLEALPPAQLGVELALDGKIYRAVTCKAGISKGFRHLQSARMWESGRMAQHFDLRDLQFADEAGNRLPCYGSLDLVGWPGSLTFTTELQPDLTYTNGPSMGVVGNGLCVIDQPLDIPHRPELEPASLTVECWVNLPMPMDANARGWLLCKNNNEWAVGHYGFSMLYGKVSAFLNNTGGRENQQTISQHGPLSQEKWHHLALTYDGTTMRFYVDGREQGHKTVGTARVPGNGRLRIGKRADGHGGVASALYDQVRIWNRALSPGELTAHARQPGEMKSRDGLAYENNFDNGREITPPVWTDAELRLRFKSADHDWQVNKHMDGEWKTGDMQKLTLNCNLEDLYNADRKIDVQVSTPAGQAFPVRFDPALNAYVAEVNKLKRSFPVGYVKITDYDEFNIVLDCRDETAKPVPFLLDLRGPANITGLVPILCHEDGTPTGIPVQVSKNWHYAPMGSYLRAFALVPVKPGPNRYRLRIPYGFYGSLPSASHAQLCLVGYGGNQRWDQLALACGGEAITFDVDMSLTDVAVCDVRLPLGRIGKDGNTWGWTDAGWGGDWLGIYNAEGNKLPFAGMKAAYLSHGPCLSDVLYKGAYGSNRSVLVDARLQFPRTDDYGRTFQKLDYRFQKELKAADTYFMRRHARAFDRVVAYGNAEGLIAEKRVTGNLKKGDLLVPPTELSGPGPWWVAFPERDTKPTGYVSMIVRNYAASFSGQPGSNPFLMVRVEQREGDKAQLETCIVPPPEVKTYRAGDYVTLDTEWVHLVTEADNYGGPNAAYRQHLQENPRSWKTTYREAVGNDLEVNVTGGELVQELPMVIRATAPQVSVQIQGGVGYVPVRFEGLKAARGIVLYEVVDGEEKKLDQAVHGNDFWQTDYHAPTRTWSMSFNIPVDGKASSLWILKSSP